MAFGDTVELERSLLSVLMKSQVLTRTYMHRVRIDWFTSEERKFVASVAQRAYLDAKSQVTRRIFEHEVALRVEAKEQAFYIGEWNIIEGMVTGEAPEILIEKLTETSVGRRMLDIIEDAATKLESGDIPEALSFIKSSFMQISLSRDEKPTREITDYEHRKQLVLDKKMFPDKYQGLKTGIFPTFDRRLGGLYPGELTLIAGVTGLGKSTLVKALQWGMITQNPYCNVLHIANEEYDIQVEHKFDALITEIPYMDFKLAKIGDREIDEWVKTMEELKAKSGKEIGRIFVKEVPAFTDVTLVESAYRELENQGIKISAIIIDHLPHVMPIMKAWGENDERAKAAGDCKELARSLHVPVIVPTQAATDVEEKQMKGRRAGKLDVYGSKAQIHVANNFGIITFRRKAMDQPNVEDEDKDVIWLVDFKKTRDGANFSFPARHYVQYGKVLEIREGEDEEGNEVDDAIAEAIGGEEGEAIAEAIGEAEEEEDEEEEETEEAEAEDELEDEPVESKPKGKMTTAEKLERMRERRRNGG